MRIIIAGGSGFLGTELKKFFDQKGYKVLILSRNPANDDLSWDGKRCGKWERAIDGADVLLNLSGKSVDCRYNQKNKSEILSSRVDSTRALHGAISKALKKPRLWINASSATIYIHAETELMTEETGRLGDDFSMNICKSWEWEFFAKSYPETRQVALRSSIVFGDSDGAFPKLRTVTKLGLGGRQGRGNQMVSWIHIADFCEAVNHIIDNGNLSGAVNVTSPNPIKNAELMKLLCKRFRIPFGFPQSPLLLELGALLIGTETELLLKSRYVFPEKLLKSGFRFRHPTIEDALDSLG